MPSPPPRELATPSRNNAWAVVTHFFLIARTRIPALDCICIHDAYPVFCSSSTRPSLAFHALNATKFRLSFLSQDCISSEEDLCISEQDILRFKANHSSVSQQRRKLREKLRQQFDNMTLKDGLNVAVVH